MADFVENDPGHNEERLNFDVGDIGMSEEEFLRLPREVQDEIIANLAMIGDGNLGQRQNSQQRGEM